jgi:transposase-like protein
MHHVVELVGGVRVTIRTELRNQLVEMLVAGFQRNVHSAVKWSNENKIQPPLARASVARNGRVFINSSWSCTGQRLAGAVIIYLTHLAIADLLVGMSKKKVRENGQFPETLHAAIRYFADEDQALKFMVSIRWPNGVVRCPRCHHRDVSFISTRKVWKCKHDKKQFSIKVGTVMEDSPISLDKWLCAFWLIANAKNGISSYELHRSLGVTQKTAWFLLHRIRLAMQDGSFVTFKGQVEADETYIGAKARYMPKTGARKKAIPRPLKRLFKDCLSA